MRSKTPIIAATISAVFAGAAAHAVELRGTATVSITSETAATAKNIALGEARRQIISDSLRQYADASAVSALVSAASGDDLMNLISSTGIDGEQTSDTTYSANITMTINPDAARSWLARNNVQNWIPDGVSTDMFTTVVTMSNTVENWIELNRIARDAGIKMFTKYITGNQVTLQLPTSMRSRFTIAVRDAGWRYAADGSVLRIWK